MLLIVNSTVKSIMVSGKSRNTEKQNLVKEILTRSGHTMTVEGIIDAMPINVNKTTVYRILERFTDRGEVHSITGANGITYYALCKYCDRSHTIHNHIHFECKACKEVTCQSKEIGVPNLIGFEIEETQFLVIGICNKCK